MSRLIIVILCGIGLGCGGCTTIIANRTRHISEAMYKHASRTKIEAMTGPAVSEKEFDPPFPSTQAWDGSTGVVSRKVSYVYRGRADDTEAFQAMGMVAALTLGIGEFWTYPKAVELSSELERRVHRYEVWYDANGKCVAARNDRDMENGG